MLSFEIKTFGILLALSCIGYTTQASYENHVDASAIGAGLYSAGFIGNYAGQLTSGKALSELQLSKPVEADFEEHDFSEGAVKSSASHYETLGSLADHLEERSFPADYSDKDVTSEYEEAESDTAATEQHEEIASFDHEQHNYQPEYEGHSHFDKIDFGSDIHGDLHGDFHSKPVVGIDHGKGAFSYSTLYEHKHGDEHEHKELL